MLTVGQLVEIEHLGLSVEAGAAGLDQQITWAHVCELDDPRRWLDGGELIMTTGLAVPRQAAAQAGYVDRLCEAGAAALGIAAGMSSPPLTATMRRRADAAGFPVLRVSYEVPFLAISQVVQAANSESYERSLLGSLTIFDSLRRGTTVFASAAEVLTRLEVVSGYALGLASADRALIFGNRGLLDIVPEVVSGGDERPVVEVAVRDGRRRYALPLSIAGRFSGFLLAEERHPGAGLGALALQNVATVAAVQLAAIRRSRDLHFRIARETFDDVFSGVLAEETIKRRVELAGLDGDADLVLLCLEGVAGREGDRGTAVRDLYGALCDAGVLTLVRSEDAIVWIAMAADDYRRLGVEDRLAAMVPTTAHVGVSRAIDRTSDDRRAASEARWAMAEGCRRDVPVVDASFARSRRTWKRGSASMRRASASTCTATRSRTGCAKSKSSPADLFIASTTSSSYGGRCAPDQFSSRSPETERGWRAAPVADRSVEVDKCPLDGPSRLEAGEGVDDTVGLGIEHDARHEAVALGAAPHCPRTR